MFYLYLCLSSCVVLHILHCPLSGPDLTYISLLIIFCIIEYVTNKKTLNLDHYFITFNLHLATSKPPRPLPITFRQNLHSISPSHISSVESFPLPSPTHFSALDVNTATDPLCSTLTSCLDHICSLSSRPARAAPSNSWLSDAHLSSFCWIYLLLLTRLTIRSSCPPSHHWASLGFHFAGLNPISLASPSRWPGKGRYPDHINWSLGFLRGQFLNPSSSPHTRHQ